MSLQHQHRRATSVKMGAPKSKNTEKGKKAAGKSVSNSKKKKTNDGDQHIDELQPQQLIPLELQQLLLNIFRNSFSDRLQTNIQPLLQEVKHHLYNRDFLAAFGRSDYLEAYAARWSPSRVLGFLQVFVDVKEHFLSTPKELETGGGSKKVVCLGGGGGAEIVAWAGFMKYLERSSIRGMEGLEVVAIDIANWTPVIETLYTSITTAPPISKYASAAAQTANVGLLDPATFVVRSHQFDVLNTNFSILSPLIEDACFITIMFTLNELYSTSMSLTQQFLLQLTVCVQPGTLLLIGDSPGSYSTVSMAGNEKRYPMQWLLDHTLLRVGTKGEESRWEKLREEESRWWRMREELKYPIELENMRFQLHLYRRLG